MSPWAIQSHLYSLCFTLTVALFLSKKMFTICIIFTGVIVLHFLWFIPLSHSVFQFQHSTPLHRQRSPLRQAPTCLAPHPGNGWSDSCQENFLPLQVYSSLRKKRELNFVWSAQGGEYIIVVHSQAWGTKVIDPGREGWRPLSMGTHGLQGLGTTCTRSCSVTAGAASEQRIYQNYASKMNLSFLTQKYGAFTFQLFLIKTRYLLHRQKRETVRCVMSFFDCDWDHYQCQCPLSGRRSLNLWSTSDCGAGSHDQFFASPVINFLFHFCSLTKLVSLLSFVSILNIVGCASLCASIILKI